MSFLHYYTSLGSAEYQAYYATLAKPFFAPPDWLFGLAWGGIYPLIGIAAVVAIYRTWNNRLPGKFLFVFGVNMLANLLFTPIQLGTKNNLLASADILVVLVSLIYLEYMAYRRAPIIFWLLVPYLVWGSFATILLLSITVLNW